jgi:acetyl coenzyme A synthetase (ADP forming)-like protein
MRVLSPPAPALDDLQTPRLVLRDGSAASVRIAQSEDRDAIRRFFHELSPEDRFRRFLTATEPADAVIDRCCGAMDPRLGLTLLVSRRGTDGASRIVAVASYVAVTTTTAEVAFAVSRGLQGQGVATLLLERLAAHAAVNGFERFTAAALADNTVMLSVFRESGFTVRSTLSNGCVDVELPLMLDAAGVTAAETRRRRATVESLTHVLRPRGVAVIGASRDSQKIGSRLLSALKSTGYTGALYAVHPDAPVLQGVRAFRSARELPPGVDLAIVSVPAVAVLPAVEDCAHAGVRGLVVVSAGFAESGQDGRFAQDALVEIVRGYGMRMVGPNCMGLLNLDPAVKLNASFSPVIPPAGSVALASQSGALGIAVLDLASERDIGLSSFVSVGNKADVSSNDLLEYWEEDEATRVVLLYLESFGNPRRFARIARRVSRSKPVVALKAGRTEAGSRAAGSHTAALASNDAVATAIFRQTGVIRADTLDEMFDIAACLDLQPLPAGNRVAIVTNAGGPGILAVDACETAGLSVASLGAETLARLADILPTTASHENPIDMVAAAGPSEYRATLETVLRDSAVDAVIAIYTPIETLRSAAILASIGDAVAAAREAGVTSKPVVVCTMTRRRRAAPLGAGAERLPTYMFPENAVRALGKIASYAVWRRKPEGQYRDCDDVRLEEARGICRRAIAEHGPGWLTADETWRLLAAFNLPLAAATVASSADEAVATATAYGYPVAAKIVSRLGHHKTDIGGVRLGLATPEDVRRAYDDLIECAHRLPPGSTDEGVLIQPMVTGGVEAIAGVVDDPVFGPLVGFGVGGVNVELLGAVQFRVAPLTDRDVVELIHESRAFPLLQGGRRRPPADVDALRDVVARVSWLAQTLPQVMELDLNPVVVLPSGRGCRILDARVRLRA